MRHSWALAYILPASPHLLLDLSCLLHGEHDAIMTEHGRIYACRTHVHADQAPGLDDLHAGPMWRKASRGRVH